MTIASAVALPASFLRRAVIAVAFLAAGLIQFGGDVSSWAIGLVYFAVGLTLLVRAWIIRRRPALIVDGEGIRTGHGSLVLPWSQAALIWVDTGPFRSVYGWTAPALDFAERTGANPDLRFKLLMTPTAMSGHDMAAVIGRFAPCPVETGRAADLRARMRRLRAGTSQRPENRRRRPTGPARR